MERLTARDDYGAPYYPYCDDVKKCGGYCAQCNFETKISEKLAAYEDAEEQGLLVKLPCRVGDTVYYIDDCYVYSDKVKSIDIRKENDEYIFTIAYMDYREEDFGKTVFLTQAEAEQKLKEMTHDNCKDEKL